MKRFATAAARPNEVGLTPIKRIGRKLYESKKAYLFLLPLFFFLLTFSYYPAISGVYHSFFDWKDTGESRFTGIENYREFLSDTEVFWPSCLTMLKLLVPKLIINIFVPLIVAEMIFNLRSERAKSSYRLWILIPIVAPGVVTTMLWNYIYDPNFGLLTALYKLVGGQPVDWLNNTDTVIPAIIFMGFPWIGGTNVLIYISGLNALSPEVRESARLDGAGTFSIIWNIDLPQIFGQMRFFLINGLITGMQDYSVQFLLTGGGPGYYTMVPGYFMYQAAFTSGRMGYASAIGTFLFVLIMGLTVLSFRLGRKESDL
ncbi:MAG: sugar ABC transporter permease [Clostridia bacterium]|nr:sugar ABC transporter permease [Clostridia bacterium]